MSKTRETTQATDAPSNGESEAAPKRRRVAVDDEVAALSSIIKLLTPLPVAVRRRVLDYVADKFHPSEAAMPEGCNQEPGS
jgi:hypothetical protein